MAAAHDLDLDNASGRPFRGPPRPLRLLGPVLLAFVAIQGARYAGHFQPGRNLDLWGGLLLAASVVPLYFMRRHPPGAFIAAVSVVAAYALLGYPRGPIYIAIVITLVNAVVRGHRAAAIAGSLAGYVAFLGGLAVQSRDLPSWGAIVGAAVWLGFFYAIAEIVRAARQRRAEEWRLRRETRRRHETEERMRIAHELHDLLAHNISMINVQASVALHLMDERPEQAREALAHIKQASNETLREVRGVLDILRSGEAGAPRLPAPSVRDLDELIARTSAAGLTVHKELRGDEMPLPPEVGLALYRVVQEALTNVARHSTASEADVHIEYGDDVVLVRISDTGPPSDTPSPGAGVGLAGMKERVAALQGTFSAGPRAGGYVVEAAIPLERQSQ